ncbi:MAG: S8 family serine peptidase [Ignavibacteria bacterium]|nr:S8 family serine peptidase [Ignavibacteria bacterium]
MKQQIYRTLTGGICLLAFTMLTTQAVLAQREMYRITFRDKGQEAFVPGMPLYDSALTLYHPNALRRRERMGLSPVLQPIDQPILNEYLSSLRGMGLVLRAPSAWRNSVLAELDTLQSSAVSRLPYVKSVVRTAIVDYRPMTAPENCSPPNSGESTDMHSLINTLPMIERGVSGTGISVCLIDEGFLPEAMSSLAHIDIRGRYDVIMDDDNVGNEPEDEITQGGHGSLVLSIIGGWEQGHIIGIAPFSTYLLAKSEDMRFERRSEEDNFYSAVEWAERNGADIISASVGYFKFDDDQEEMQYSWLDGRTTFVSQAYNHAAQRGVIVVAPSGNGGPRDSSLITPADADSAICVGGSLRDRSYWPGSSVGPTADGRIKPDVAALGASVHAQAAAGNYINVSGTSMSTPQIAGCMALLKQLYPEAMPWTLRDGLYASASAPDSIGQKLGRGIPDVVAAARTIGMIEGPGIGQPTIVQSANGQDVFTAIYSNSETSVTLQFLENGVSPISSSQADTLWNAFSIAPSQFIGDTLHARITAVNEAGTRYYPSDSTWFAVPSSGSIIPCGVRSPSIVVSVDKLSENIENSSASNKLHVSPSPAPAQRTDVFITGVHDQPLEIVVIGTTSAVQSSAQWSTTQDGNIVIHLPPHLPGHYIVLVKSMHSVQSVSLIRL